MGYPRQHHQRAASNGTARRNVGRAERRKRTSATQKCVPVAELLAYKKLFEAYSGSRCLWSPGVTASGEFSASVALYKAGGRVCLIALFRDGLKKGSAMKMISKPNPSHQKTDMVSSTGRMK